MFESLLSNESFNPRTFILACVAAAAITAVFVARPAIERAREETAALRALQTELEAKRADGQSIGETVRLYQQNESIRTDLQSTALARSRELEIITALETAAEASGITVAWNVGSYTDVPESPLARLAIQAQAHGSYRDILRFLARVERLPQYVLVRQVVINDNPNRNPDQPDLQADITFHSYWQ